MKLLDAFVARKDVQFVVMEETSEVVVELSAIRWNVVFVEFDANVAVMSGPPGLELLFASPY